MSHPDDHTIDADPDSVERIREIARQAAAGAERSGAGQLGDEHTVDADESTLTHLRELAARADPPPARAPRDLSQLELPDVAGPPARPVVPIADGGEPWRPPPRSVRPVALPEVAPQHATHPIWRTAAIVLAMLVLVLAGWLLFGGGDGADEQPPGPTVTGPSGTVIATNVIGGEGGSGG